MNLIVNLDGTASCLWDEAIDLTKLGKVTVRRASRIEWDEISQAWWVQTPDGKPLFNSPSRNECLRWERENEGVLV